MSIFGPALLFIPLVLCIEAMQYLPPDYTGDDRGLVAIVLYAVAAIGMRFFFASWYARDKGRNRAWGLAGVFGIMGWIVLWVLPDLSQPAVQRQVLSAG